MTVTTASAALKARVAEQFSARLPEHLERLHWDSRRLAAWQRDRLRALLTHAIAHSPYHARRLRGVDPDRFELTDLGALPVMTKTDMMTHFDDVVSDRRLTRNLVEDHLAASTSEPRPLLDEYVCLTSGGSSGERGVFVYDLEAFVEFIVSVLRTGMARIVSGGGPPPGALTVGLVAAAAPIHPTGFVGAIGRLGPARMVPIPATLPLSEIVDRLNALQPQVLIGYGLKVGQLAAEQEAGRLRIRPQSVITTSEVVSAAQRAAIEAAFRAPVMDSFGSTEGLVGSSAPGQQAFSFASDMCIVEPVDVDHRPVPPGTASARVLVTNLYNSTQPLIRYELTDRFVTHPTASEHGHFRASVDGRSDELFTYGTLAVHPHVLRSVLVATAAVSEYEVRQTTRGIDVRAVRAADLDTAALAGALADSLRRAGLPDPQVSIRVVDAIERHPDTGKARRFIALGAPDLSLHGPSASPAG